MPHGHNTNETASDKAMETMCSYPPSQHAFPHWKCVSRCCANFPRIDLIGQALDRNNPIPSPMIQFHVYQLVEQCTVHGICTLYENKICRLCLRDPASMPHAKQMYASG